MIFKQTRLTVSDNTNVVWLQAFQLYYGFKRKFTKIGFFVKGSAKIVEPPRLEYKGFKFKFNKKGDICRGFIIRVVFPIKRPDGSTTQFRTNTLFLLKKRQEPKSKYLHGPTSIFLRRKKYILLFNNLI